MFFSLNGTKAFSSLTRRNDVWKTGSFATAVTLAGAEL